MSSCYRIESSGISRVALSTILFLRAIPAFAEQSTQFDRVNIIGAATVTVISSQLLFSSISWKRKIKKGNNHGRK